METVVVPFEERHVAAAAELLAGTHGSPGAGTGQGAQPRLDLGDADTARELVEEWRGRDPAVAALADGRLVGFMAATMGAPSGQPRTAKIRPQQCAAEPTGRRPVLRLLYGALAGRLTAAGAFEHAIAVPVSQRATVACCFELGFGIDQILGVRAPLPARAGPLPEHLRLREAAAADLPRLLELTVELQRFHAEPPMLRPPLVDLRAIEASFRATLADDRRLLLLAEEHGRVVGMFDALPDGRYLRTATIGVAAVTASARARGTGSALLSGVLAWAGGRGFAHCGAGWTSANPSSDAFWRGRGFTPVQYKLTRLIDPRVARTPRTARTGPPSGPAGR